MIHRKYTVQKFYKVCSDFKNDLRDDFVIQNNRNLSSEVNGLSEGILQKLLNRFLFLLFAEAKSLLPPNGILKVTEQWERLKTTGKVQSLYSRYQKYFKYLNTGFKGKQHTVFPYNGGLFEPDKTLDVITFSDALLHEYVNELSLFDFNAVININILGGMFENDLNRILDTNTALHRLCMAKKQRLKITDNTIIQNRKASLKKLKAYQNWLLNIKICDSVCGGGLCLIAALDFLVKEHDYVAEMNTQILGDVPELDNISEQILMHNIYGIGNNQTSVEVTKLVLWLRTVRKGKELVRLDDSIKCSNVIAGKFDWYANFPSVFRFKDKQGFHVVLTTHNSRTSQRMIKYKVEAGLSKELNLEEEIILTRVMGKIIKENSFHCLAYNVCMDHVHLLLVCEQEELPVIVKTIKGKSSFLFFHSGLATEGDDKNKLWSQKFFRANLDVWGLSQTTNQPGYYYKSTYLANTMSYIENNRLKHKLPISSALQQIIDDFVITQEQAFADEYGGGFDIML